jgi:hypothetical protein
VASTSAVVRVGRRKLRQLLPDPLLRGHGTQNESHHRGESVPLELGHLRGDPVRWDCDLERGHVGAQRLGQVRPVGCDSGREGIEIGRAGEAEAESVEGA